MAALHILCFVGCMIYFPSSVKTLAVRPFLSATIDTKCSVPTRRAPVGCTCALVGVPCGDGNSLCVAVAGRGKTLTPGICTCSYGSSLIPGTTTCSVAIFVPTDPLVSATACPGDNVFLLACGGPQPITCGLTFSSTSSVDALGVTYKSSQIFLSAVSDPSSGCCYATVTGSAPSTDALICYSVTAKDAAGTTKTGSTCALIKTPPKPSTCPKVPTTPSVLTVAPTAPFSALPAFAPYCQKPPVPTLLTLAASGGTAPFTYSIVLTSSAGLDIAGGNYDGQPLAEIDAATGRVTVPPGGGGGPQSTGSIYQCFRGIVMDKNGAMATTAFCIEFEGSGAGVTVKICPP